jgi:uncharacterized membrane protein YcaP (DUF421 family)
MDNIFEWERVLFNKLPVSFLFEVVFRSAVMFIILLLTLRLAGKRGVKQLSVFETVIIIALGSAAGDPMFYEDVGIVHAIIVFIVVMTLYRGVTWLTGKSKFFEKLVEGKTECLVDEGAFSYTKFEQESIAQDEFFSELRIKSIDHLGQVRKAYLEPSGEISVYFYADQDVRPGLPLHPELFNRKTKTIANNGIYACATCGRTQTLLAGTFVCETCGHDEWVVAIASARIC